MKQQQFVVDAAEILVDFFILSKNSRNVKSLKQYISVTVIVGYFETLSKVTPLFTDNQLPNCEKCRPNVV